MCPVGRRADRGADIQAGFRHSGTTRTGSNDMDAASMLFILHGWDIHAVRTGWRARGRQSRQ
jgi:hypothetical protein